MIILQCNLACKNDSREEKLNLVSLRIPGCNVLFEQIDVFRWSWDESLIAVALGVAELRPVPPSRISHLFLLQLQFIQTHCLLTLVYEDILQFIVNETTRLHSTSGVVGTNFEYFIQSRTIVQCQAEFFLQLPFCTGNNLISCSYMTTNRYIPAPLETFVLGISRHHNRA